MGIPVTTPKPRADRSSARLGAKKRPTDPAAKRGPKATHSHRVEARDNAASQSVAVAFARIVAERFPGTSWLPVEPSRNHDGLVMPAGKMLRLLPSPANVDASARIGDPAAPAAYERAPYEYGANPGA
jgi:hypothetical protein